MHTPIVRQLKRQIDTVERYIPAQPHNNSTRHFLMLLLVLLLLICILYITICIIYKPEIYIYIYVLLYVFIASLLGYC